MATERDVYSAMQEGDPLARYKKVIVGKVHVVALNPFTGEPEGVILEGIGNDDIHKQIVELWDFKAVQFFERMNKKHIDAGRITKVKSVEVPAPSPNIITDEEIDVLLNSKFLALKNRLVKFTDTAPLFRLVNKARELEKSEKIIAHIEGRISEIQLAEYGVVKEVDEEK